MGENRFGDVNAYEVQCHTLATIKRDCISWSQRKLLPEECMLGSEGSGECYVKVLRCLGHQLSLEDGLAISVL